MSKKKVVIITTGYFPEGDAGAVRLRYIARAMIDGGFDVEVLCRGVANDSGCVDNIRYTSFRKVNGIKLIRGADYYLYPMRVSRYLNNNKDLSCVYIYNAHISVFKSCKRFCEKYGIRLVHDCVEWYSPEEFKRGEKSIAYRIKSKINTQIIDKSFSVIAISSYLEKYFSDKNIATIRIPILCDSSLRSEPKQNKEKLVLFYAGAPLKKDLVGNVLEAALLLTAEERRRLQIVFVGVTKKYLIEASDVSEATIDACSDFLELCGRVPRKEVLEKMEYADFTVLSRDASLRYAKAGFPSKIVESLSNATPVMCNYSSDLELYLKDGKDALIAKDHTPEAFAETIRRALLLSAEDKQRMSEHALACAKEKFDYRNYTERLKTFIENGDM